MLGVCRPCPGSGLRGVGGTVYHLLPAGCLGGVGACGCTIRKMPEFPRLASTGPRFLPTLLEAQEPRQLGPRSRRRGATSVPGALRRSGPPALQIPSQSRAPLRPWVSGSESLGHPRTEAGPSQALDSRLSATPSPGPGPAFPGGKSQGGAGLGAEPQGRGGEEGEAGELRPGWLARTGGGGARGWEGPPSAAVPSAGTMVRQRERGTGRRAPGFPEKGKPQSPAQTVICM